MTKPFHIYSSSAGSGKTYTLAKEYLKLVLQTPEPFYFRHILAITFTNDAATEMKDRILTALRGFANPVTLPENKRPGNQQLLHTLLAELNQAVRLEPLTEKELRRRAGVTFSHILHDYTDFAVGTIDSFVNRLVGAFAEELDIPFNYEVTLEGHELVDNAVDRVLDRIGRVEEEALSEILEAYALETTDEGRSWSGLPASLAAFGRELLTERVAEAMDTLRPLTLGDFRKLRADIDLSKGSLVGEVAGAANACMEAMDACQLAQKHFAQGQNGIWGYFNRYAAHAEGEMPKEITPTLQAMLDADEWATAATKTDQKKAISELRPFLVSAFVQIENRKGEWLLLENILQHFYKLSVIHEIGRELRRIKADKNQVLISDFNQAIVNVILQEPVPFIYERLGEKYNHILIDEFQDTSVLQWNNLLPLVENGLAKGHFSLIVGDAKQAIYRWRGGDMEQIVHLANKRFGLLAARHRHPDITGMRYETVDHTLDLVRLNTNYRSAAEIVAFNNELFQVLAERNAADRPLLADVYDEYAAQQVPVNAPAGGHVEIQFIPAPKETPGELHQDGLSPYERNTLEAVLLTLRDAAETGYAYGDMAVLCRQKKNASRVANFLKSRGVEVISQDSLLLEASPAVSLVMALLHTLHTPDDSLARYEALHLFYRHVLNETPQLSPEAWRHLREAYSLGPLYRHFEERGYLLNPFRLQQMGLYELGEKLVQAFRLTAMHGQSAYVYRFLDVLLDFSTKQSNHLAEFMAYWERKKDALSINSPKNPQAVTVTTIHKAKGMEYPVVVMPFADWDMLPGKNDIWWMSLDADRLTRPSPVLAGLNLRHIPLTPKKELVRTPLRQQYLDEAEKLFIENLNLLYVALTRPTDRLYLLSKENNASSKREESRVSRLLCDYLEEKDLWQDGQTHYVLHEGSLRPRPKPAPEPVPVLSVPVYSPAEWHRKARLRRLAARFFDNETPDPAAEAAQRCAEALCRLDTAAHLDACLDRLETEGLLPAAHRPALRNNLLVLLADPQLASLFAPQADVKPVKDILSRHTLHLSPPDRVVLQGTAVSIVSYVPGPPTDDDAKRLNRYAAALRQMGYALVEQLIVNTLDLEVGTAGDVQRTAAAPHP